MGVISTFNQVFLWSHICDFLFFSLISLLSSLLLIYRRALGSLTSLVTLLAVTDIDVYFINKFTYSFSYFVNMWVDSKSIKSALPLEISFGHVYYFLPFRDKTKCQSVLQIKSVS